MWFTKLIKQFFFWIDKIVYNFIPAIYDLLLDIARTSILTQADIADMADRIYKLLAIFMIFKVTLSLITYVVNPDDFSDKTKGVAKLGTNIIISLSLLILTPYIFNYAYQLQTIVLEDNSLATLIFGDDLGEESFLNSAGDEMSYIAMQAFFSPNLSLGELHECTTLYEPVYDETGKPDGKKFNEACKTALESLPDDNFSSTTLQNYVAGVENSNLGLMFRQDLALATAKPEGATEEDFVMDYKFIFSTVVGVVIILLLITFCMDVAVRSLKLAFFQLIAPIPILSYVDPKTKKDGLSLEKWAGMCFKTFLSLFIRLLALYFAVYIISKVGKMQLVDIIDGSYKSGFLLSVFIIIGALMFAKQLPEILKGLGIKLDGDGKFTLNPLKKFEEGAIGGKQMGKGIRGVGKYAGRLGKGLGTAALVGGASAITGHGFRGAGKAISGAWKGDKFGKNFSNSYSAAKARHKQVEEMKANGVKPGEVRGEKFRNFFGGTTRAEKVKQVADKSKSIQSNFDAIKNQAVACDSNDQSYIYKRDKNGNYITDASGNRIKEQTKSAKTISKELDEMKKTQIDRNDFKDIVGKTSRQKFDDAVTEKNTQITELENRKRDYQDKISKINIEASEIKTRQANLKRDDFSNENEYYEAYAACTQRLAVLDEQKRSYDIVAVEKQINDTKVERDSLTVDSFTTDKSKTADEQYYEAITKQKNAIKDKEAELEARINDLVNGRVRYVDKNGNEHVGTGIESADKVIEDSKKTMEILINDVNNIGSGLIGEEFKGINTTEIFENGEFDVVKAMKQSKGTAAQASSGEMSHIQDIAQYTKKNN